VDIGEIDAKALQIWSMVVDKLGRPGQRLNYGAATAYFRNKCAKMGVVLPAKYLMSGAGAETGRFRIMDGDQIEDWVKERMKSAGLLENAQQVIEAQKAEVAAVQTTLEDLLRDSVKAEPKKRGPQKKKLEEAEKQVAAASEALVALEKAVEQHEDVDAPVISFEQQFQLLLHQAMNDLSRKQVLAQAKAVLAQFEAGMNVKQAGVLDSAGEWLEKLWGKAMSAFAAVKGWASNLLHSATEINKLFASVK